MTESLLVVHIRFPDGVGEALEGGLFTPALPPERRVDLNDPMHAYRARYAEDLEPPGPQTRLVSGPVPFGYMDRLRRRAVHAAALGDPERAFLRFAARLAEAGPAEAIRLSGEDAAALDPADPDRLAARLLDLPRVRARWAAPMTALCAGLPWRGGARPGAAALRAARANLGRINFLVGDEAGLDAYAGYLAEVFGWAAPKAPLVPRPPLTEPERLDPALRARLREALSPDPELWESMRGRLAASVA